MGGPQGTDILCKQVAMNALQRQIDILDGSQCVLLHQTGDVFRPGLGPFEGQCMLLPETDQEKDQKDQQADQRSAGHHPEKPMAEKPGRRWLRSCNHQETCTDRRLVRTLRLACVVSIVTTLPEKATTPVTLSSVLVPDTVRCPAIRQGRRLVVATITQPLPGMDHE